jgi:voltage-gated sodium channel
MSSLAIEKALTERDIAGGDLRNRRFRSAASRMGFEPIGEESARAPEPPKNVLRLVGDSSINPPGISDTYMRRLGVFSAGITRTVAFRDSVIALIIFNAIWVGIDADLSDDLNKGGPVSASVIDIVDLVICLLFVFELSLRIFACYPNYKRFFYKNDECETFNIIDLVVTCLTFIQDVLLNYIIGGVEEQITFFLISRALRLFRIVKLFVIIPALSFLAKALGSAVRSVASTVVILITAIYIYAIVFTEWQTEQDDSDEYMTTHYSKVFLSMLSMFQLAVYDEAMDLIRTTMDYSLAMGLLALSFVFIGGFLILNVLIGVIADVVAQEADLDEARQLIQDIDEIFSRIDSDNDNRIAESEFLRIGKPLLLKLEISDYIVDGIISIIRAQEAGNEDDRSRTLMIADEHYISREEFILYMSKMLSPPSSEDLLLINKRIARIKALFNSI